MGESGEMQLLLPLVFPDATPTLLARIQAKIRLDADTGCQIWIGAYSKKRRGRRPSIRLGGRGAPVMNVARIVCTLRHGPPPTDLHEVGHTCPAGENARCVGGDHLRWMTRVENEQWKGRGRD